MARDQAKDAQALYDNRAANYDASFHDRFSSHAVQLLDLEPGEQVLDLACGTGLVTFKAAELVGSLGNIVGVDISTGMLDQAHAKLRNHTANNIQLYRHSITELDSLLELQDRKFDAIICASALVLLPDPAAALRHWATHLKPGGRLITDATHPKVLLPGMVLEHVGRALGASVPSYRAAFQAPDDLARIMRAAGLVRVDVKRISQLSSRNGSDDLESFLAASQEPLVARTYAMDDAVTIFDRQVSSPFGASMTNEPLRSKAEEMFKREWAGLADSDGVVTEIDEVFVGLGWSSQS